MSTSSTNHLNHLHGQFSGSENVKLRSYQTQVPNEGEEGKFALGLWLSAITFDGPGFLSQKFTKRLNLSIGFCTRDEFFTRLNGQKWQYSASIDFLPRFRAPFLKSGSKTTFDVRISKQLQPRHASCI